MASPREELQNRIVSWVADRKSTFNAPYGILPNLQRLSRGAVRTITFGRCRTLDATLYIWGPNKLVLDSNRGNWEVTSEQELYKLLSDQFGARA